MAAKHLLACVDFSERSTDSLAEAGEYARANGSKVTLLHVSDPQAFIPPQAIVGNASEIDEATHRAALEALRDQHLGDVDVEIAVVADYAPARAICDYAQAHDVDLIIVGSHGRGRVEHWLIGSVAERVVRHATTNVYVVRR